MKLISNPVHKSQRDNKEGAADYLPGSEITCNTTSLAMVAEANGVAYSPELFAYAAMVLGMESYAASVGETPQFEDFLTVICNSQAGIDFAASQGIPLAAYKGKLNQWYSVMAWAMNRYLTATEQPFKAEIHQGLAIGNNSAQYEAAAQAVGELNEDRAVLAGTMLATLAGGGGHIVCLVGYTDDHKWILNDPYGNPNTDYKDRSLGAGEQVQRKMSDPYMLFTYMVFIRPT